MNKKSEQLENLGESEMDCIDNDGNYYIPDEFKERFYYKLVPYFETLWHEELQFYPQLPIRYEDREIFKEFFKKYYDELINTKLEKEMIGCFQKIVNEAYKDGFENGRIFVLEKCIRMLKSES